MFNGKITIFNGFSMFQSPPPSKLTMWKSPSLYDRSFSVGAPRLRSTNTKALGPRLGVVQMLWTMKKKQPPNKVWGI